MKIKLTILLLMMSVGYASCVTRLATPTGVPEISVADYESAIAAKTKKVEIYDGFYNQITVQGTRLDSSLTESQLSHNARLFQWDLTKYNDEKNKAISKHASNSEFFISFYTPERKHNDLSKIKTMWKMFLDVDGQRYEGKAVKVRMTLSELQVAYPYHNRWSTPYIVTFPVATALTENKPVTVTFTGAISSSQLKFE
ncbi:MAG: hypothetical protein H7061_06390 [Bdellovibrionaceae bacterium]|nr:hypothetical protein [Bdellovibrio sp.]